MTIPVRDFGGPESVVVEQTDAPGSKGHQDHGGTEQKMSADDMMLLRINEEKPVRFIDLCDEDVPGFSKANIYKVKARLLAGGFLKAVERPALTKQGVDRVQELLLAA